MNIVGFTLNYPPARYLGAEVAVHYMYRHLARQGHTVTIIRRNVTNTDPYEHEGVTVHGYDLTLAEKADVIVYQAGLGGLLTTDVPRVAWAHSLRHGAVEDLHKHPPNLTIHNTAHQQAEAGLEPSIVIHPPVDYREWTATPGGCVTFVNPTTAKGSRLFYRLAALNRHRKFLTVAGGYGRQNLVRLANVIHLPHTADMNTIYARTRVLLMPSERESWGMVAVEAAACGIPTISSDLPGPREALEGAALYADTRDHRAWNTHLKALDDPDRWSRQSQAARARAQALDPIQDAERFETALLNLVEHAPAEKEPA